VVTALVATTKTMSSVYEPWLSQKWRF